MIVLVCTLLVRVLCTLSAFKLRRSLGGAWLLRRPMVRHLVYGVQSWCSTSRSDTGTKSFLSPTFLLRKKSSQALDHMTLSALQSEPGQMFSPQTSLCIHFNYRDLWYGPKLFYVNWSRSLSRIFWSVVFFPFPISYLPHSIEDRRWSVKLPLSNLSWSCLNLSWSGVDSICKR